MKQIFTLTLALIIMSCGNSETKERTESEIRQEITDSINNAGETKRIADSINKEIAQATAKKNDALKMAEAILGKWYLPYDNQSLLLLERDLKFSMTDYNRKIKEWEYLIGTYQIEGNRLTLLYSDRPKQIFTVSKKNTGYSISVGNRIYQRENTYNGVDSVVAY